MPNDNQEGYSIRNNGNDSITYNDGSGEKTLKQGEAATFEDSCTLFKALTSMYKTGTTTRASIVANDSAAQKRLEEMCAQIPKQCDIDCSALEFMPSTAAQSPQNGKVGSDSGDAQGSPQQNPGAALSTITPTALQSVPPSPDYTRTDEESNGFTHAAPIGGEKSGETSSGGDPVDLYQGTFTIHEADLVLPNTVLPLSLIRFYRSGHPYPGPFAWNWDHNHNIYLRELQLLPGETTNHVVRWTGTLHEDLFRWNGDDFDSPRGVFQKLIKLPTLDPNGLYELQDIGGITLYFDRPSGWTDDLRIPLLRIVDRFGNKLVYAYDSENRLQSVTCQPVDQYGAAASGPYHYLQFTYGNCGLLEMVSDSLGRQVQYWHDPDIQHLVRVNYPGTSDHPDGMERNYYYGDPFLPEMLRHNILRVEDGDGNVYIENDYDEDPSSWSYGRVLRQLEGGNLFQFIYDPLQWMPPNEIYINVPAQRTEIIDPEGGLTTYTFNFRGDILDRRTRLAKDGSFWITATAFEYDAQGNRTRMQYIRDFEDMGDGEIVHIWGLGEFREYFFDHDDPRMRGIVKKIYRLDGTSEELTWEGTYDPDLQLLLTEHGQAGDGFTDSDLTTTYHYSLDSKGKLLKISHPTVTLPDGSSQTSETEFEVNLRGQTTAVITPEGIRHELVYSETAGLGIGRLLKRTGDAGTGGVAAQQIYTYDSNGFLSTVTDPTGAVTTYSYNVLGQIEQITPPAIGGSSPTTVMHYNGDGLVTEVHRPRGGYTDGTIQGDHIVDRIVRNVLGHMVRSEIGANTETPRTTVRSVDHRGLPLRSTDPVGTISRWQWDERGLLIKHNVLGGDGAGSQDRFIYMRDGRVDKEIYGPAQDRAVQYEYGPFGRISRVHDLHRATDGSYSAVGATRRNYWSERGLLQRAELRAYPGDDADQLLSRTEFVYDARSRLVQRIERPFSAASPFVDATTPKLITKFFYDRDDRLVKIIDPRGGSSTISHDGLNRILEWIDPLGNKTAHAYDFISRTTRIEHHDIETDGTTVAVRTWKRRVDARGRLVEVKEPDGASKSYEYDDRDLVTAIVERDGTRREYAYGLLNEMLSDTLDPSGLNIVNHRTYDLIGRLTGFTDPAGETTTYAYDGIGRLVSTLRPGDTAARTMTYGMDGRLATNTLPSGITFNYTYDNAGRMATMNASNVPTGIDSISPHSYSYDTLGRLTSATAGSASISRAYDSLSRLLSETTHGELLKMAYNDLAGTAVKSWPDGRQETLTANLNGVVTKIERTASGSLGTGSSVLGNFTPYGPSMIGKAALLGGINTNVTFDERKRISQIKHDNAGTTFEQYDYRYDTRNRRRVELVEKGTVQSRLHLFDTQNRLTGTHEGSSVVSLASIGTSSLTQGNNDSDITTVGSAIAAQSPAPVIYEYFFTTSTPGKADERLSFKKTDSSGTVTTTSYSYTTGHRVSGAGSETVTHRTDGTRQSDANNRYEVDALGRIVRVKDPTGSTTKTALEYDPLGRVAAITPATGSARQLSYFGGQLWQERTTASVQRQFSYHPGMPGPLATHVSGESYMMHHDARLNLMAVTDNGDALKQRYRYEPFGMPTPGTSTTGIEPRFGGLRWLDDTSLYLGGARMMDPRHGLWLSQDPLGYIDSPNLYAYAGQNPIDYVDPMGLSAGKGAGGGNSDGGMGSGSVGAMMGSRASGVPGAKGAGTSRRSLVYGPGDGPGIAGPKFLMDLTDSLRNLTNSIRDGFSWLMDNSLGRLGPVGEYTGGILKRLFDYWLTATPLGFGLWEENLTGTASMIVLTTDAIYNPAPSRYERLGQMTQQLATYLAHASASEWGGITVDVAAFVGSFFVGGAAEAGELGAAEAGELSSPKIGGETSRAVVEAVENSAAQVTSEPANASQNYVYRALREGELEDIMAGRGISRGNAKTTPTQHINGIKHFQDPWVSTTRSLETAEFFSTRAGTRTAQPIIQIDLERVTFPICDVSTQSAANELLTHRIAKNFAIKHQEVLIHGGINQEAIIKIVK